MVQQLQQQHREFITKKVNDCKREKREREFRRLRHSMIVQIR